MVLGKEKLTNEHRTFEVKRLSESQRKDGGMVMALCRLLWRQKPDEPASNEVPVRVLAGSKVPQRNLPDVLGLRAPDVESRRVYFREEKDFQNARVH